jgi:hypothetical protein
MADDKAIATVEPEPRSLAGGRANLSQMSVMVEEREAFTEFVKGFLKKGQDYGEIPGAGKKQTLLKPGAEKILRLYNCRAEYDVQDTSTSETRRYIVSARVYEISTGLLVATGVGSGNSGEQKYQQAIQSRNRRAGESAKRRRQPPPAEVTADDLDNTVLKMAKKRALVDAAQALGLASEFFTQDLDEVPWLASDRTETQQRAPQQAPRQASQQNGGTAYQRRFDEIRQIYEPLLGDGVCRQLYDESITRHGEKNAEQLTTWAGMLAERQETEEAHSRETADKHDDSQTTINEDDVPF